MFKDVEKWVKICIDCAQKNRPVHNTKLPLLPTPVTGLWDVIATDCVGPLPTSLTGNKYIIIISDLFTKYVEAFY